jgi:uncharacterized Ntn-hydrolase superfamily protein/2-keto-3-deoxy-L-rhamnonate aldolase RhmA
MRRTLVALWIVAFPSVAAAQDVEPYEEEMSTFSIIARDPATGQLGEVMTSKALAGGNRAWTAKGGVAMIAHQQSANPMYGKLGMELIELGLSPQEALDYVLRADEGRDSRQVAIIDAEGRTAAWTSGSGELMAWRGHHCGVDYCTQGNSLTGPEVIDAVAKTFEAAKGTLAERMLTAIEAGQLAGGDARGKQTALLIVVRPLTGNNPTTDRVLDLRVDDHPEPLGELRRIFKLSNSGAVIAQGNQKLRDGDMPGAIALFEQARDMAPTSDNAWIALANAHLRNGQKPEALAALGKAIEVQPINRLRLPRNQDFASLHQDRDFLKLTAKPASGRSVVERLAAGQAVFGIFSGAKTEAQGAKLLEDSDPDFVFYSLESPEEGPFDMYALGAYLRGLGKGAGANGPPPVILRIPPIRVDREMAPVRARQGLEQGAAGIVYPHANSADDAALAVSALGTRVWPADPNGERFSALIVEDQVGVGRVREIVRTPGIGVVIAGPGDLSRAYDGDLVAVEKAIQTVLAACKEFRVPCGITAGVDDVGKRLQEGFRFFIVSDPAGLEAGKRAAGRRD